MRSQEFRHVWSRRWNNFCSGKRFSWYHHLCIRYWTTISKADILNLLKDNDNNGQPFGVIYN